MYDTAKEFIAALGIKMGAHIVDIGGGKGRFSSMLPELGYNATLFDYRPERVVTGVDSRDCNLNGKWPAGDNEFDAAVSLEVIEHVENPRHFVREMLRIVKPGAHCLISTPNQLSVASKLCFLLRNQHQWFQDSCYPGHIAALLEVDLQRIAREAKAVDPRIFYSGYGRVPGTRFSWQRMWRGFTGRKFSDNVFHGFGKSQTHEIAGAQSSHEK